jgi:hypothetical protein
MKWQCQLCGMEHTDVPLCFGTEAPWRSYVPEEEFEERVELTADQCVIDEKNFFVRGHIDIPIHDYPEPLLFSVWVSLSETSFLHMTDHWDWPDRDLDPPYFGWLLSSLDVYPNTVHLKVSVQSRTPGLVPLMTVEPTNHPLALDQHQGISIMRWHTLVHQVLHDS